jgi:hypothetical protein
MAITKLAKRASVGILLNITADYAGFQWKYRHDLPLFSVLVGDGPYYARVGFSKLPPDRIRFPARWTARAWVNAH